MLRVETREGRAVSELSPLGARVMRDELKDPRRYHHHGTFELLVETPGGKAVDYLTFAQGAALADALGEALA